VSETRPPENKAPVKSREEIGALVKRARKGDRTALPGLREVLCRPGFVDLLGGNLAQQAERSFIEAAAGNNLLFKETLTRKLEELRAELAGPNPTPVEKLLVERVVACWLQVQDADMRYAQAKDLSLRWLEYYQHRMDRAHARFLAAVKALAAVRRLAVPVLQVNIARKQVNVAGACPAVAGNGEAP
jgi:hypothetical protein